MDLIKLYREMRQYLMTGVIRQAAKVFWFMPVEKNKILFTAFAGENYTCNPKYITEYLLEKYQEQFELVWILEKPEELQGKAGIKAVKMLSLAHFYHFCTAKVIVDNGGMPTYMPKRKGQYLINTWHGGGPFKKNDPQSVHSSKYRIALNRYKRKCTDLVLSSSRWFSTIISDIVYEYQGEILPSGLPRNDIFFSNRADVARERVRSFLGIDKNTLVILYAPTFRGDFIIGKSVKSSSKSFFVDLDTERLCAAVQKRFGKKAVVLFRKHLALKSMDVDSSVQDVSDYPDMQELLCAADILVTDYSSSMWDYALLKRPCFLYAPDVENYLHNDRGVYSPIETWPGILAQNNDELEKVVLSYNEEEFFRKVERFIHPLGSYETGTACEYVCRRIAEVCSITLN